jgi:threonylcarbamoyladenosine tRNA methylthiotransferase MtaB
VPTYRIVTLGCKLNQADSSALEARLRALGLSRLAEPNGEAVNGADLVILNTCTVTSGADREARQIARRLRRANPEATLIATGCYAERDRRDLAALAGVDHVVGMQDQAERVGELAARAFDLPYDPDERTTGSFGATDACDPLDPSVERTRAYLKIQDGCDLRCAYCIIPSVRGDSRSLEPDEVLRRIAQLSDAGYREIVFTGVNTGDYGRDLDSPLHLHDLLERALALPGLGRLRLNSLEPKTVTPEIIRLMAASDGRLARHIQIPLQSGCDTVLARMRRNYRTADYARAVKRLRTTAPSIGLGADVIVGFPGESDREFETTCRFIEDSPLNYLHVFSYSPRPGTPATALPDQVTPRVIKERSARLRALGRSLSHRFRSSFVGRTLPILTLRALRPDGRLRALSDNFIDLGLDLEQSSAGPLINRLLPATITEATPDDTTARLA